MGDERRAAHRRAFELIYEIQAGVPGSHDSLHELVDRAAVAGWPEVTRAGLFGNAVASWLARDGNLSAALDRLRVRCQDDGDLVMVALALAMSASFTPAEPESPSARDDADLARAVVLLEHASGGPMERISAHTACGIALGVRWLWELSDEQYAAALEIGTAEPPGSLDFLLAPIVYNRAEAQVSWASTLRQLDPSSSELRDRVRDFEATMLVAGTYAMPDSWRAELASLGLLLTALAGEDVTEQAGSSLEGGTERSVGHLHLALALSQAASGVGTTSTAAAASAEQAIELLDPDLTPHEYDLALHVAAEIEASRGATAGLRSSQRQFRQRWANRISALDTMRERIRVERLSIEHEMMRQLVHLDDLTGVGNRRALQRYLQSLVEAGVESVAFIFADIDGFKTVNDRYGHAAGDEVLVRIARLVEASVRPDDLVVRLGGDEFAIVLANVDIDAANRRLANIMEQIDALSWDHVEPGLHITLSVGMSAGQLEGNLVDELQRAADEALYAAKAAGGRQAVTSAAAR
jgi:diguanylate cyclase (GGDEF)-like protein